ncbi:MAG: PASTA domain-containing protein [Bacteroidales bacterium]
MKFVKFITSKLFLKHLAISVGVLIALILITLLGLRIYTHHGQTIHVPDLTGYTIDEAREVAEAKELRFELVDSVYNNERKKGTVIDQNPPAGFQVKKNRRILITSNAFNPEKVTMPNVVGVSHRQAKSMLKSVGLEVGKLIHVPDIAINNVLRQQLDEKELAPGSMIEKGTKVDLVLGSGLSSERTGIPDLYEFTYMEARDRLLRAALNVGATIYDESVETDKDSARAKVWRQYPSYKKDKQIRLGTSVDLWLSIDSTLFMPDTTELIDSLIIEDEMLLE